MRHEIRFSGSGGQGMITAAVIFAEAATRGSELYVCQSQSYGPEARGGRSRAEVVLSDTVIDYPRPIRLDILLAMNQASCDAYFMDLKPRGILLVDSSLVEQVPTSRAIGIPFTRIAREDIGREITANMVALGAVAALSGQVAMEHVLAALLARVPPKTHEMNQAALERGAEEIARVDMASLPGEVNGHEDEEV